jgi:hypothetical protein
MPGSCHLFIILEAINLMSAASEHEEHKEQRHFLQEEEPHVGKKQHGVEVWSVPFVWIHQAHGTVVHLVNFANGILVSVNEDALHEIQLMESVLAMEIYRSFLEVGSPIICTIDI